MNQRKLLLHEKVEVRQYEEGLRGSWHPGVVVAVSDLCRYVQYDELLCDTGDSKLVEVISVTKAVDGLCHRHYRVPSTYRGHIRPQTSPSNTCRLNFTYGLCVDAFYDDAWWEGVVFDREEGAEERSVFFPDEGDELKLNVRDLRVSRVWDEFFGVWRDRGVWVLMELMEELENDGPSSSFLKKVWFHLRFNAGFVKRILEWTSAVRNLWSRYLMEVLLQISVGCSWQTIGHSNLTVGVSGNKGKQLENSWQTDVGLQLHNPRFMRSNSNGFHIGDLPQIRGQTPYVQRRQKEQLVDLQLESRGIQEAVGRKHLFSSSRCRNALTGDAAMKERNQFVTKGRNLKTLQKGKDNMGLQALAIGEGNCCGFPVDCSGHGSVLPEQSQPLKIRLKSMKLKPLITYQTKDNEFILDKSTQEKDMISDAAFTESNSARKSNGNRFPVDCVFQHEVSKSHAVPSKRKKSDSGNLMKENSKALLVDKAKDKELPVDSLNREREKATAAFLMPKNVVEEDNINSSSIECFHQPEGKVSFVPPKHTRQSVKKKTPMGKLEPLWIHEVKDNEFGVHNSRGKDDFKADTSLLQVSQSVFERPNRKTRYQSGNNEGIRSHVRGPRKRKGNGSSVIKEKGSIVRGRSASKKFQQVDGIIEFQPNENQTAFDSLPEHEVVTSRRGRMHFSGYDKKVRLKDMVSRPQKRRCKSRPQSDTICLACHYGGKLILCDSCRSSYHLGCIGLENVPNGNWFCPSCRCGVCGLRDSSSNDRAFTRSCYQCTSQYHVDCLSKREFPTPGSSQPQNFCSQKCLQLFGHLRRILGKSNPTSIEGLCWTMLRSGRNDIYFLEAPPKIDNRVKLSNARDIMQECFEPIIEPCSKRNLVVDIIFNRISKFKRLDFHGFYTMVLQKGDEIICVATVRIHGLTVAEMPLIGTRFQYRQQGMCRLLMNELEKMLNQLRVERLVLPAVPHLSQTWKNSFGFTEISHEERVELLSFPLLFIQGTTMYQKMLTKSMTMEKSRGLSGLLENSEVASGFLKEKENQGENCQRRFCGFYYKRKPRNKIIGKENMVESCNGTKMACKYVYKRRRIFGSNDSSINQ